MNVTSVLAAILIDMSDESDVNLIYTVSEQMSTTSRWRSDAEHFKTNQTPSEII